MGSWRASNGHAEPYHTKFWQVGNELAGAEYDKQVPAFCKAMKEADPSIKLFSSFPSAGALKAAGEYFDFVCPHHYSEDLPGMDRDLENIGALLRETMPQRSIKIAVTEWNTTAGDWGTGRAKLMTLANALACSRYHNLLHRHCDLVEIANRSNLINSFGSGIIQVDNHRLYKTPTYYAQQLYAQKAGTHPLRVEGGSGTGAGLDISATLSDDSHRLTIFVVNDQFQPATRQLDLSAFGRKTVPVKVSTLSDRIAAGEPDVRNGFSDPDRISVRTIKRKLSSRGEYIFPPLSLTVVEGAVE
jgi:alpha-N-arabinofuranosidase